MSSQHRQGAVVELLGAPGAGKSTVAEALGGVDGTAVVKDHAAGDLPALLHGVTRSMGLVLRSPPGVPQLRWTAWAGRSAAAPAVARRRHRRGFPTVVFDQGPAYTWMRMRGSGGLGAQDDQRLGAAVARLLDLVVLVDADPETLRARLRGRGKPHRSTRLSGPQLSAYVASERASCEAIVRELAGLGTGVLRLDTATATAEVLAGSVHDALAGPVADRRRP